MGIDLGCLICVLFAILLEFCSNFLEFCLDFLEFCSYTSLISIWAMCGHGLKCFEAVVSSPCKAGKTNIFSNFKFLCV